MYVNSSKEGHMEMNSS